MFNSTSQALRDLGCQNRTGLITSADTNTIITVSLVTLLDNRSSVRKKKEKIPLNSVIMGLYVVKSAFADRCESREKSSYPRAIF